MKEEGQHGHLEPDVLAEYQAGLVTGRRRGSIASHLAACAQCAGLSGQLAEVSALLAAAPVPAMPADVARRLDTVLAAEAVQRHSPERAVDDSPPRRASNPRPRGPRRRWDLRLVTQRILVPAAAVVLLAAGGFGLSRITGSSSSSSAAEGSAAAPASTFAGPAAGAAVPSSQTHAVPAIEAPRNFPVVTSTTDYQRATLRQQLETELRRAADRALGRLAVAPGSLQGCVQRVTAGTVPGTLILVERAHFQGQPAIVIVAAQGHHDAAWVVASGCSASSAHILATATLPGTSAP